MSPLVSVVMPVYNGERFLCPAVDSILGQSLKHVELIIVDDGSTDRTVEILQQYALNPRVRIHRMKVNSGAVGARNEGMTLARGEFIAAMDADDVALPQRLRAQHAFLQSNPDVGIVGSYVRLTDENDAHGPIRKCPTTAGLTNWSFFFLNGIHHPTAMIRRAVIERIGGYADGYNATEDFEFFSRASRHVRMANIPHALVRYRRWGGNVTANQWEAQEACANAIVRNAVSHFTDTDCGLEMAGALRGLAIDNYPTTVEGIKTLADLIPRLREGFRRASPVLPADQDEITRDAAIKLWLLTALALRLRAPVLAASIGAAATRLHPSSLPAFARKAAARLARRR